MEGGLELLTQGSFQAAHRLTVLQEAEEVFGKAVRSKSGNRRKRLSGRPLRIGLEISGGHKNKKEEFCYENAEDQ